MKRNNLDLLRLVFALQVLFLHAAEHLGSRVPTFIDHFPGVPAFFFVSGFLIYASYKNSPGWRYVQNRFLRIYPAMIFCCVGMVVIALIAHGWGDLARHGRQYAFWFLAQVTLGQTYNPAFLRDVGVGVLNGSLWTITTEVLFYFCVPLLARAEANYRFTIHTLTAASFLLYAFGPHIWTQPVYRDKTAFDVLSLTPLVWGWMFGTGILAFKYFERLKKHSWLLPLAVIPVIVLGALGSSGPILGSAGNTLGIVYFLCYVAAVFWLAFRTPAIPLKADLSYGVYIWHMPVINLLLVLSMANLWVALAGTLMLASISWFLIEKPCLKLKKRSLRSLAATDPAAAAEQRSNLSFRQSTTG